MVRTRRWRTGANAATHFASDRDLLIDGQTLPAGTYTLTLEASDGTLSDSDTLTVTVVESDAEIVRVEMLDLF